MSSPSPDSASSPTAISTKPTPNSPLEPGVGPPEASVNVTGPAVSESPTGGTEAESDSEGDAEGDVDGDAETDAEGVREGVGEAVADFLGFAVCRGVGALVSAGVVGAGAVVAFGFSVGRTPGGYLAKTWTPQVVSSTSTKAIPMWV